MLTPEQTQAEHFDDIADEYEESIPTHVMEHLDRRRVALAESLVPSGRVLDVGCGTGKLLAAMPARYEKVGIDPSQHMLGAARGRGLEVQQASAETLPFEDASFDLVMTHAVLHHVIDPAAVRRAVTEMCRVARPGGAVLVWDHNPLNPYWKLLMRRLPQDRGDERLVPAAEVLDAVRAAGMADVRLRRMTFVPDFTPPRALRAAVAVERFLERTPVRVIAAHNVVTARRPAS